MDVADEKGESGQGGMYVGGRKHLFQGPDPDPVPWMHIQETGQSCLHVCEYIAVRMLLQWLQNHTVVDKEYPSCILGAHSLQFVF